MYSLGEKPNRDHRFGWREEKNSVTSAEVRLLCEYRRRQVNPSTLSQSSQQPTAQTKCRKELRACGRDDRRRLNEIETISSVAPMEFYNIARGMCRKEQRGCAGASIHE